MFETVFATDKPKKGITPKPHKLPFDYESRCLLMWEEHCVECSPPYCYHHCVNYQRRKDNRCVRMQGGIRKSYESTGSLPYAAVCTFRKWAKLEAMYASHPVRDIVYRRADKLNECLSKMVFTVAHAMRGLLPSYAPYSRFNRYKNHWLTTCCVKNEKFDLLYMDCELRDKEQVQLMVQIDQPEKVLFSQMFTLKKGDNQLSVDTSSIEFNVPETRIFITPMNEETDTTIVFTWLDLFRLKTQKSAEEEKPAEKIKVVVWDLDNTLWKGTLVNDSNVVLNDEALSVVRQLDQRGILNSIASKNDYQPAFDKLKELGIDEYFLCPAINWGQKSLNIKEIAKRLNLGISSFAFIDDNVREREEVKTALPMVRVFDEKNLQQLLKRDEFNVPVSELSKKRRLSYMQEVSRKQFAESFSDNYEAYLRNLGMTLEVYAVGPQNQQRCFELVSRSNQLNLTTNRYTEDEFQQLLKRNDVVAFAFGCKDKFGDYGIISFLSLQIEGSEGSITDFVVSCRVAKKKVENAIITSLKEPLAIRGVERLKATLIRTKKNGPLSEVFRDLPFNIVSDDERQTVYLLPDLQKIADSGIIKIDYL
ncbi:HAD-IIIC family phosphatase [Prevotella sp. E13-17]|uniref:HAD-IIIC family phosphatase n=1 Tax=Prevotella sp. E13-17 TaxID=2913616 RepID=UPI001EDC0FE7|nr:HAD-IIIC family phosphatase [Prevotella sp. E13-17]UKK51569.1 HAD-IIIC family phosphatase [Prevotella sp. E13-17]